MQRVYEPELIDLLNLHKRDIMNSINCHAVATIQSYDPSTKTCKATIVYKKTLNQLDVKTGQNVDVLKDYPPIISCPVINLSGGGAGLRFPIKKGDVAFIHFNDKDLDNWFLGQQSNGATATKRMHHFSDSIAIVGLFSENDAKKDYEKLYIDKDSTVLFDGEARIAIKDNLIKITNKPTDIDTLGMILQELITNINLALTTLTVAGNPSVVPGTAALLATAVKLQGLLK